MTTLAVHPLDLRIGQFIRFNRPPAAAGIARVKARDSGRIAARTISSVLIEQGLTQAGTKVLVLVPNEQITGVWIGPPQLSTRTLVPVRHEPVHGRRTGLGSRIFRDTPPPRAVAGDGALRLDEDRTPWAS